MAVVNSDRSVRSRVARVLITLVSVVLLGSAAAKFAQVPVVASKMAVLGFDGSKLLLIAVLELVSAILFALPRTRAFGLLMASAYLGGAIAAHVGHNQAPFQPVFVLALLWIAAAVWNRETLWTSRGHLRDLSGRPDLEF